MLHVLRRTPEPTTEQWTLWLFAMSFTTLSIEVLHSSASCMCEGVIIIIIMRNGKSERCYANGQTEMEQEICKIPTHRWNSSFCSLSCRWPEYFGLFFLSFFICSMATRHQRQCNVMHGRYVVVQNEDKKKTFSVRIRCRTSPLLPVDDGFVIVVVVYAMHVLYGDEFLVRSSQWWVCDGPMSCRFLCTEWLSVGRLSLATTRKREKKQKLLCIRFGILASVWNRNRFTSQFPEDASLTFGPRCTNAPSTHQLSSTIAMCTEWDVDADENIQQ